MSINAELSDLIDSKFREFKEGTIVNGTIIDIRPQVILVDIGYKSEGAIPTAEFEDEEIEVGDGVEVLIFARLHDFKDHGESTEISTVITRRFHGSTDCQDPGLSQRDVPLTFSGEVKLLFFFSFVFCHGGIIGDGVWAGVGAGGISPR